MDVVAAPASAGGDVASLAWCVCQPVKPSGEHSLHGVPAVITSLLAAVASCSVIRPRSRLHTLVVVHCRARWDSDGTQPGLGGGELTLMLTTHFMDECDALCGRVGIMTAGHLRCLGSPQHLKVGNDGSYIIAI